MGYPHRRRLVTLLDVGVMASGSPGGGDILPILDGLGVWYKADDGASSSFAAQFTAANTESLTVDYATHPTLQIPATSAWTMGGWVWLDSSAVAQTIQAGAVTLPGEWQVYDDGTRWRLGLVSSPGGYLECNMSGTGSPAHVGGWHFLCFGFDPNTGGGEQWGRLDNFEEFFGRQVGRGTCPPITANLLAFGGAVGSLNGRLQNWFLFSRTLTNLEQTFLWNGGTGRRFEELTAAFKTGLRGWWDLGEASGSRFDRSGNNNTLTDVNTVTQNVGWVRNQTGNGSGIQFWNDSGPNDFDLGIAAANNAPAWIANERNGKAVARFDGVDDVMKTASMLGSVLAAPQAQTVFVVQKQLSTDASSSITYSWDSSGGSTNEIGAHLALQGAPGAGTPSNIYYLMGNPVAGQYLHVTRPEPWADTWHISEFMRDPTTALMLVEGNPTSAVFSMTTVDPSGTSRLAVGDRDVGANPFQGDIAELIIYNRTLTTTERDSVRNYLKAKWGIAQNKLMLNPSGTGYLLLNPTTNDRLAIN